MAEFATYREKYSRATLRREGEGILEVRLHGDDGPMTWDEPAHRELPELWHDIGADTANRVVILTGTGDAWCPDIEGSGWDFATAEGWDKVYTEGKALLQGYVDIPVPVICAVNGPVRVHSELAVMGDIVLAAEEAVFMDIGHFPSNFVPGDGVHIVWQRLLGPNRGRHFLLTGAELDAAEALAAGVVAEVLPRERLIDRAWEVARQLAENSTVVLRNTRVALNLDLKKALSGDELGYGLMLEASGAIDLLSRDRS